MKIDRKFLIFRTRKAFDLALLNEEISSDSIVFIEDQKLIWTHNTMFGEESTHARGFFKSVDNLPEGTVGDYAIVNVDGTWYIYYYMSNGGWTQGDEYQFASVAEDLLDNYVKKDLLFDYIKGYYDNVYVRKDELYTEGGSAGGSGSSGYTPPDVWGDRTNHIFTTQQKYDALTSYKKDAIYFILEGEEESDEYGSKFGDTFPFKFGWAFGTEFPVILN